MIIELNDKGRLEEYYNPELQVLEHFKYKALFLRRTKDAYISFISKEFIDKICQSQSVAYSAIHCRFKRRKVKLRLKELRSCSNSFLRKNGIISELVDILPGRVPPSVFARHYLAEDMRTLSAQVLPLQAKLWDTLEKGV